MHRGEIEIRVRIGVHTGRAQRRDGAWFGADVNLTARVQGLAGAAQVLVTETTRRLVGSALEHATVELALVDAGTYRLRSFDDLHRVYVLDGPHLSIATPVASTNPAGNLPDPPTSFVGRSAELAAHQHLLEPGALVTIVGLGGLGKTRTAIEVARRRRDEFGDGAWWIDLTPVTDRAGILSLIASTLALTPQTGADPEASLLDSLRDLQAMIVLDNCEHLVDAAAAFVAQVRASCPQIGLVATSREVLGVGGERIWRLEPLEAGSGAVELLLDRAAAADPLLDTDAWDRAELAELCQRLDGMPLCIEMAAARLRSMSPADMIERLDDRFRLLRHRRRDVDARHQTLMATIDWSYDLLDSDERILLDRLSVFAGGFDAALAHEVCGDGYDEFETLDLLDALVDRSLVQASSAGAGRRYRLPEAVRAYGAHHLDSSDQDDLGKRLVPAVVARLERCERLRLGVEEIGFLDAWQTLRDEWDNVRETLRLLVAADDEHGVDVVLQSIWAFSFETFRTEVLAWSRQVLTMSKPPPIAYAVGALWSWIEGDVAAAAEQVDAALAQHTDPAEPDPRLTYVFQVAVPIAAARRRVDAPRVAEHAVTHARALAPSETAYSKAILSELIAAIDPVAARALADDVHRFLQGCDNPMWAACLPPLASAEATLGDPVVAHRLCVRAVELTSGLGLGFTELMARLQRARTAARHGVGDAASDLAAALAEARRAGAWFAVRTALSWSVPLLREHGAGDLVERIDQLRSVRADDSDRAATVAAVIAELSTA